MTMKSEPFLEGKWGWDLGENNWKAGADENFLKFSYMLNNNVDGFVSSLPGSPVNGTAYYLTTDMTLNARIDGSWYKFPVPKGFVVTENATGDKYEFSGSTFLQTLSSSDKTKLDDIEAGATSNSTDAALRDRSTHTGTQAISTISGLQTALDLKASLSSPTFTGTPTSPTVSGSDNSTKIATTAWVKSQNYTSSASPTFTGTVSLPSTTTIGSVSGTEIEYLDGVTSNIQIQFNNITSAASGYAPINNPTFTGTVSGITKTMVGLGNVDNTSDINKPVSTATQTALNGKQNSLSGTGFVKISETTISYDNTSYAPLSSPTFTGTVSLPSTTTIGSVSGTEIGYLSNVTSPIQTQLAGKQPLNSILTNTTASFTTAQETKLSGIAAGAEVNVNADWNSVSGDSQILNKPTIVSSSTDTTSGRLLTVGYEGLGVGVLSVTDMTSADVNVNRWLRVNAAAAGGNGLNMGAVAIATDGTPTTSYLAVALGGSVWRGVKSGVGGTPTWAQVWTSADTIALGTTASSARSAIGASPSASPTFTGTVSLPSTTTIGSVSGTELSYLSGLTSSAQTQLNSKENTITAGTTSQYWRGDKSWQTLDKNAVGLSNIENTALSTWSGSTNVTTIGAATALSLSVTGNLTVNGTTTTVNSTTMTVTDPVITLGGSTPPSSDDNKDRGIEFRWHNGTSAKAGFFGRDDTTGRFIYIPDATNTSEVFSGTLGDIEANTFYGSLSGNATTASSATVLTTGRTIGMTGDVVWTSAPFNGSSNVTGTATISNSGVIANTYGSSTQIPVYTVNSKGLITSASNTTVQSASTSVSGIVQLTDSTSSTSLTTAATPNSVKTVYDLASTTSTSLTNLKNTPSQTFQSLGTVSGSVSITASSGMHVLVTVNGNTTWTFPSPSSTEVHALTLELTNGGAYTMTWPSGMRWTGGSAPVLTSSGTDILVFTKAGTNNWRGYLASKDSK